MVSSCTSQKSATTGTRTAEREEKKSHQVDEKTDAETESVPARAESIRFATFNTSLNRKEAGKLILDMTSGRSKKFGQLAEVIQRVRPHVILLNEVDYDAEGKAIQLFREKYLAVGQNEQQTIKYPYVFMRPVNTGVDSELDLNQNGETGEPADGFGFGGFPGQYGMVVLSQFPIDETRVRTFQNFLWKDMPDAMLPTNPDTGKPFYPASVIDKFRLSSKSHWDVPVMIGQVTVHLICSHPTPPVFDGPEDRNGARNHDEIRLIADYISGDADYLVDDEGVSGGLPAGSHFVIVGDLNADPLDGDSVDNAARLLTEHPMINHSKTPSSKGAVVAATNSGGKNADHKGAACPRYRRLQRSLGR